MKFEEAVVHIFNHEGGYVFDSKDPGGETKYGISKRAYPAIDIKNLTMEKAKAIYKMDYWDMVKADLLPRSWRLLVFDCAVNQGVGFAVRSMQKVVGVKPDGIIGPITRRAFEDVADMDFIDNYAMIRLDRYINLPHWSRFGKGWSKRLLEVSLFCAFFADLNMK